MSSSLRCKGQGKVGSMWVWVWVHLCCSFSPLKSNSIFQRWWFSRSVVSDSCDPMDCSLPGSSVHGIFQGRILEWVAISFSRGIFPIQESKLGLLHCRKILHRPTYEGSPFFREAYFILWVWKMVILINHHVHSYVSHSPVKLGLNLWLFGAKELIGSATCQS